MGIMMSLGVTQYRKMCLFNFQTLITATSFVSSLKFWEKAHSTDLNLKFKNQIFKMNRTCEN